MKTSISIKKAIKLPSNRVIPINTVLEFIDGKTSIYGIELHQNFLPKEAYEDLLSTNDAVDNVLDHFDIHCLVTDEHDIMSLAKTDYADIALTFWSKYFTKPCTKYLLPSDAESNATLTSNALFLKEHIGFESKGIFDIIHYTIESDNRDLLFVLRGDILLLTLSN